MQKISKKEKLTKEKNRLACAKWIMQTLKEHNGEISIRKLQYLAIPKIYDPKDLYDAILLIEDKVEYDSSKLFNQKLKLIK